MTFRPTLIEAPLELPVTAAECKAHAIVEHDEDNALIETMIKASVSHLDGFRGILGRAIVDQTWRLVLDAWSRDFVLPVPDVSSVAISYENADGEVQLGPEVKLAPVAAGTRVVLPKNWGLPALASDSIAAIRVDFVCGFGGADAVPQALKVAIMQMVAHQYVEREGVSVSAPFYDRLISPYRWVRV
ncbi:hypothetical protein [Salipiger bermudensis]|uniref:head-tail connector protein n=1 Tax=Salipiger bermudensis TaxID=344736 RepID=UPI001CD3FC1E|nr:hypothetical protein [Salipiger bermudensis]MCA0963287.1 hypothetical protein [Salipiger bermudensis]